jgi:hypothetical protein
MKEPQLSRKALSAQALVVAKTPPEAFEDCLSMVTSELELNALLIFLESLAEIAAVGSSSIMEHLRGIPSSNILRQTPHCTAIQPLRPT